MLRNRYDVSRYFPNGTSFEIWYGANCAGCLRDALHRAGVFGKGCPLLRKAFEDETAEIVEWVEQPALFGKGLVCTRRKTYADVVRKPRKRRAPPVDPNQMLLFGNAEAEELAS